MPEIRRTWREAGIAPDQDGRFALTLDGRTAKTPEARSFALPTLALAEAVAAEWRAQEKIVRLQSMPLTQLAATAIDRIEPHTTAIVSQLTSYAAADLLCHRAPHPQDLQERQERLWQPLLNWLAERYGVLLRITEGIAVADQEPQALAILETHLAALAPFRLAGVSWAAQMTGSAVLALALDAGRLTAEDALALAELDAIWQAERWGEDADFLARSEHTRQELATTERFLRLLA